MDDLLHDFVAETTETLDVLDVELVRFEQNPAHPGALDQLFRCVHTIKGTCGFLDLPRLEGLAHAAESLIVRSRETPVGAAHVTLLLALFDRIKFVVAALASAAREPQGDDRDLMEAVAAVERQAGLGLDGAGYPARAPGSGAVEPEAPASPAGMSAPSSVRIAVDRLDGLMATVSELVLVRNQLLEVARRDTRPGYTLALQRLSNITGQLQDSVMRTRMHAIGAAWSAMPRMARDLSIELGKTIVITTTGDETEIDRQILEVVRDSLVHLVRNAADHGIERSARRAALGKPPAGTIRLSAHQDSSQIVIDVEDDGSGIDCEKLKASAVAAGLIDSALANVLPDEDAARLIFRPGLSTAGAVTTLSGRGVGLDAVKQAVERAGGTIEISNRPGLGLRMRMRMPLTLAIASAMIVEADGVRFAMPQLQVAEVVRTQPGSDIRVEAVGGAATLRLRDRILPLIDLAAVLAGQAPMLADSGLVMVCRAGPDAFGLSVGAVLHAEEVVIKPLSARLRDIPYFSGATMLGDGSVALILDPAGFARHAVGLTGTVEPGRPAAPQRPLETQQSILLCRAVDGVTLAIPSGLVARLDELPPHQINRDADGAWVWQEERLVPLVGLGAEGPAAGLQPMVVFRHGGRCAALAVGEILDIVDAELKTDPALPGSGWLAKGLLGDRVIHVPDVPALLAAVSVPKPEQAAIRPAAILFEKDLFLASMFDTLLSSWGFATEACASIPELAAAGPARVLIVDLDGDARAILAAVSERAKRTTVVGTATRSSEALRADAARAGLVTIVGKFDRQALFAALDDARTAREAA